jgi:hypothetical protein
MAKKVKPRRATVLEEAAKIHYTYVVERTFFEAEISGCSDDVYRPSRRWGRPDDPESVWVELARFALEDQIDGPDYIRRAFQATTGNEAPRADQLKSDYVKTQYRRGSIQRIERRRLRIAFKSQRDLFHSSVSSISLMYPKWDNPKVWRYVLLDSQLSLTPLFRYCLARAERFKSLSLRYRGAAAVQYSRNPDDYGVVWGDWIPEKFRVKAPQLAREAIGETYGFRG